jgi:hypothetical protein
MKVREFIQRLQELPDQEATVVIAHVFRQRWLVVSGVFPRGLAPLEENPDFMGPGSEPGVEIV